jgi:hypothetical protein
LAESVGIQHAYQIFAFAVIGGWQEMAAMTDPNWITILGTAIPIGGSILVWALTSYTTSKREERTRSAEVRKRFLERQIEEFYGPLLAISHRRDAIYEIRQRLSAAFETEPDKRRTIRTFIRKNYFEKLNMEIEEILTRKLHLLEDAKLPESFQAFLTHSIQVDLQTRLWNEKNIDNQIVKGIPFPQTFSSDIAAKFSRLMAEYRSIQGRK